MHLTKPEPPLLFSDKGQKQSWGLRQQPPSSASQQRNPSPTLMLTGTAANSAAQESPEPDCAELFQPAAIAPSQTGHPAQTILLLR